MWDWLTTLPSVNFRIVFLSAIDLVLSIVVFVCFLRNIHVDEGLFTTYVTFLGALHGVSVAGYGIKRKTSLDANADEDGAQAAARAATAAQVPVPAPDTPPESDTIAAAPASDAPVAIGMPPHTEPVSRAAPPLEPNSGRFDGVIGPRKTIGDDRGEG